MWTVLTDCDLRNVVCDWCRRGRITADELSVCTDQQLISGWKITGGENLCVAGRLPPLIFEAPAGWRNDLLGGLIIDAGPDGSRGV
jgi:hypothetical protein